ncbi:hypothetical protein HMI49_26260 [Corallococcus exercitus]|uniref:Uncharacterized protein n=1 Tax=Corallococcus exercitus TaxID=2316736 RepID=A0A7Y4KN59_9BACT|nr:hypothetical protein [Corallococcus exercitus]NOK36717.1 hypothetical protein [Corallococcus exercitus]
MSAPPSSSWVFVVLGAAGLTVSALACAGLVAVLDFAWSEAPAPNDTWELEVPPPVYGPLPALTLRDDRGQPLDTGQLHGQLTLLQGVLKPEAQSLSVLRRIQERLEADGVPVRVVIAASRDESTELHPDWQRLWERGRLLLLVDQRLQVRGAYDSSQDLPTSERVIADARCLRTCRLP